jgi:hypothetical protein
MSLMYSPFRFVATNKMVPVRTAGNTVRDALQQDRMALC